MSPSYATAAPAHRRRLSAALPPGTALRRVAWRGGHWSSALGIAQVRRVEVERTTTTRQQISNNESRDRNIAAIFSILSNAEGRNLKAETSKLDKTLTVENFSTTQYVLFARTAHEEK